MHETARNHKREPRWASTRDGKAHLDSESGSVPVGDRGRVIGAGLSLPFLPGLYVGGLPGVDLWAEEIAAKDAIEGGHAILPSDLLPLGVGAPVVTDREFVDSSLRLCQAGSHLGFETETVGRQRQSLQEIRMDNLIAGLHIREVEVREHVAQQGEETIAHHVPKEEHSRPSLMAALADVPSEVRGTVMGLNSTAASAGWLAAAALGGWILSTIGFSGFGPLAGALAILGAVLALLGRS